jgi:hypothetical protein
MALDVTIRNNFDTNSGIEVCYSGGASCLNPTDCSNSISLNKDEDLEIYTNPENAFQIELKVTGGNPKVKIQHSDKMWTLTNDGANTSVQVGAGPDGQ